jgi:aspartyl-tRNA(Asn)/glutamyl-tRNA(Gln) amidotransferase subunit A
VKYASLRLKTILELGEDLRLRKVSPVELTKQCLAQIEKFNPRVNAFITVTAEVALRQAKRAEEEIARGEFRGPLHGIPIGLKDLIDTAGIRTTAGSELYKDRTPEKSAQIANTLEDAGAVLLGKQNLHEFAYGGSSMVSYFGEVRNPWNTACVAGGSSGGSAAAVATGMGLGAIGTDTAGSIREPAALCGVVGLKPTYGLVSAQGVIPLSESLDHVGPIARTVTDAAVMMQVLAEKRRGSELAFTEFLACGQASIKGLRIGVPRSYFFDDLDPEVAAAVDEALGVLLALSASLRYIHLQPDSDRTLQAAEAYAWHAESVAKSPGLYQPETLRRIKTGENVTREEYQRRRAELDATRQSILQVFETVDVIVTPATPIPAPAIAELQEKPELLRPRELLLLRNTRPFNIWGVPAISVPCGFTTQALPIGLQIAGAPGREDLVLEVAYAYEQAARWHERVPPL